MILKQPILCLYERLYTEYGPQGWWPARSRFEIIVGAILTQNIAWTNVVRAIDRLAVEQGLSANSILAMPESVLAKLIRPSGYFNIKAKRLRAVARWFKDNGGFQSLDSWHTNQLRTALLSVYGVGPETADDILLYAFQRPVFVIDSYTRRLFGRLGLLPDKSDYEFLRSYIEAALPADAKLFGEYHALIVRHGKAACSQQTNCLHCKIESPLFS